MDSPLRFVDPDGNQVQADLSKFSIAVTFGTLGKAAIKTIENAKIIIKGWIKAFSFNAEASATLSTSKNSTGQAEIGVGGKNASFAASSKGSKSVEINVQNVGVKSDNKGNVTVSAQTPGPANIKGAISTDGTMMLGIGTDIAVTDNVSVGIEAILEVNPSKAAEEVTKKTEKEIINMFK
jgi:hypothetical protein